MRDEGISDGDIPRGAAVAGKYLMICRTGMGLGKSPYALGMRVLEAVERLVVIANMTSGIYNDTEDDAFNVELDADPARVPSNTLPISSPRASTIPIRIPSWSG